jgi:SPX domain protein involved in polyphosphate accumulation
VFQLNLDQLHGDSQMTNSVYLDNDEMELYQARLTKAPHAICIRLRWYDSDEPKLVFVERKTHEDTWTGESSVKERFSLSVGHAVAFLEGEYSLAMGERDFAKVKPGGVAKTPEQVEGFRKLFSEIAEAIATRHLEPKMRTQCMRVAYQIPFQPTVRVSIDTNLNMM